MKILIFILGMIIGGTLTLFFHCCLILAKESDEKYSK